MGPRRRGEPKISRFFPTPRHNFLSTRQPESPNVHISGLRRCGQKSTRRPLREGRKNENCGGRGKKRAKFWAVRRRAVRRRRVLGNLGGGMSWVFVGKGRKGPGNPNFGQTQHLNNNSGQFGQKCWFGQSWFWPKLAIAVLCTHLPRGDSSPRVSDDEAHTIVTRKLSSLLAPNSLQWLVLGEKTMV